MKATQKNFARVSGKAASQARIFFFCGPDEAGASAAAEHIVSLLPEAGERIELAGAEIKKDPVRLGDEARSESLFGDTRHIWVRAQGDEAHDAVANLLDDEVEACPVLIVATSATDKSRTAKLLANRDDALVGMFYLPDLGDMATTVRKMAGAAGLSMDGAVAEEIARGAGLDARLAQTEVDKIALYLDAGPEAPQRVDRAVLAEIGAPFEEDGFASLVDAVLGGNARALSGELRRMHELGLNPVAVLLAFERRAAQLARLAARLGRSGDVASFLEREKNARRVFFKDIPALTVQLGRWRGKRLQRLVEKLATIHRDLMAQSRDADLLLSQGLAEIGRAASRTH